MADEIIAKYKADLKDYNSQIKKGTNQAEKDFEKVDESASGLGKTITKIGGAIAAAFAVEKIASFTAEASKLAAQGEGIRKAFERVGDPQLLQGLRDATRGTVSDLELMKNAVKASNFKIPLQELAKLFEFARRRAKETGESVQFLVESITTGIGRKSPLILDNLGISAVELKKKLNGVSLEASSIGDVAQVVGAIATEELKNMGDEADSTADKMAQLTASTENLKEALGTIANEAIGPLTAGLAGITQAIADELTELDRLRDDLAKAGAPELQEALNREKEILDKLEGELVARIGKISDAQAIAAQSEIDTYRERIAIIEELQAARVDDIAAEEFTIEAINAKVDALRLLNQEQEKLITINSITAELKEMAKELKDAAVGGSEFYAILSKINDKQKELFEAQAQTRLFEHLKEDAEEALPAIEAVSEKTETLGDLLREAYGEGAQAEMEAYREKENDLSEMAMLQARREAEEKKQQALDVAASSLQFAQSLSNSIAQIRNNALTYEQQQLQQQLDSNLITREEYESKVRELEKQKAENNKDSATFGAIINTALAVTRALAEENYFEALLMAAAGAAEIAVIQSQPIPQFATGTKDAPAGFKWVGEEGPELIYDQGGYPIITHRESMKILEKYNIPSINYEAVERGGFENIGDSLALQGFNDSNMLSATDRLRSSNRYGFEMLAEAIMKSNRPKRGGYA